MEALLLPAFVAALLMWRERQHERERREWVKERAALIERAVPGLTLTPGPANGAVRVYGTDADEWGVEQRRLRAAIEGER